MTTAQVNKIRKQREADIADVKAQAARKMEHIRKIRENKIKDIKENASILIKGLPIKIEKIKKSSPNKSTPLKHKFKNSRPNRLLLLKQKLKISKR